MRCLGTSLLQRCVNSVKPFHDVNWKLTVAIRAGDPIFRAEELEPLIPKKAGESISLLNKLRFLGKAITRLHRFWANRSSVVDPIVDSVRRFVVDLSVVLFTTHSSLPK